MKVGDKFNCPQCEWKTMELVIFEKTKLIGRKKEEDYIFYSCENCDWCVGIITNYMRMDFQGNRTGQGEGIKELQRIMDWRK